jgi:hypothetical protein
MIPKNMIFGRPLGSSSAQNGTKNRRIPQKWASKLTGDASQRQKLVKTNSWRSLLRDTKADLPQKRLLQRSWSPFGLFGIQFWGKMYLFSSPKWPKTDFDIHVEISFWVKCSSLAAQMPQ